MTRSCDGASPPHTGVTKPVLIRPTSWRILSGGGGPLRGRRGEADVGVGMLRDDLLGLPGVEQAEIDGDSATPAGVRIRLSPGVDPAVIGDEVRRVLSLHGLRQEIDSAALPPNPEGSSLSGRETEKSFEAGVEVGGSQPGASDLVIGIAGGLESVSVIEGHGGIAVTAVGPSAEATARAAGVSGPAIDQAVVSAVADLAGEVSDAVQLDETLSMGEAIGLAWDLRRVSASSIQRPTIPVEASATEDGSFALVPLAPFLEVIGAG